MRMGAMHGLLRGALLAEVEDPYTGIRSGGSGAKTGNVGQSLVTGLPLVQETVGETSRTVGEIRRHLGG
jgi:hypothetical protein